MGQGKQLNVNLNMTADVSDAKKKLQELQNTLQNLSKTGSVSPDMYGVKDLEQAKKSANDLSTALGKAFNQNTGKLDLSRFDSSLKKSKTSLSEIQTSLRKLGPEGTQAFLKVGQAISNMETPAVRINNLLGQFGTALKNAARWQISSSVLHGFMGAIQSAYGYAQDLNESLTNIRIVTGQTTDQIAEFATKANKAAQTLSTTTTAYTDAALIFYQQGLNNKAVEERTNAVIKMAQVTGDSASEVSSYMTAIWNNFDNGSKSLEYYEDVIAKLGATTASSSAEISEGISKFASVAQTAGLSYEYATSALATVVAATRQSADTVGTAFKTLFARIQDLELGETLDDGTTLGQYSEALAKIGVNIKDASGAMRSMDDILDDMGEKWKTLSQDTQTAVAQAVAGTRQYTQLVALMENWDQMKTNVATAENSEGAVQEQADIYAESWEASSKRVRAAMEELYADLIDDKFFIELNNTVANVIGGIDDFIKSCGGIKPILLGISGVFMQVFAKNIPSVLDSLTNNIKAITPLGKKASEKIINDYSTALKDISGNVGNYNSERVSATLKEKELKLSNLITLNKDLTAEEAEQYRLKLKGIQELDEEIIKETKELEVLEKQEKSIIRAAEYSAKTNKSNNIVSGINTNAKTFTKEDSNRLNQLNSYTTRSNAQEEEFKKLQEKAAEYRKEIEKIEQQLKSMGVSGTEAISKAKEIFESAKNSGQDFVNLENLPNILSRSAEGYKEVSACASKAATAIEGIDDLPDKSEQRALRITTLKTEYENCAKSVENLIAKRNKESQSLDSNDPAYEQEKKALEEEIEALKKLKTAYIDVSNSEEQYIGEKVAAADAMQKDIQEKYRQNINYSAGSENGEKYIQHLDKMSKKYEDLKRKAEEADKAQQLNVKHTASVSEGIGKITGSLSSAALAYSSISSSLKTLGDESATTSQKVSSLIALMTGSVSAVSAFSGAITGIKTTFTALTASMSAAAAVATMLSVALAAVAVVALIAYFSSLKTEVEKCKDIMDEAKTMAESTQTAYENLKKSIEDYKNIDDNLSKLKEGTAEWRVEIAKANQETLNLLESYGLLSDRTMYYYDASGVLRLTEDAIDAMNNRASSAVESSTAFYTMSQLQYDQAATKKHKLELLNGIGSTEANKIIDYNMIPEGAVDVGKLQTAKNDFEEDIINGIFKFDTSKGYGDNFKKYLEEKYSELVKETSDFSTVITNFNYYGDKFVQEIKGIAIDIEETKIRENALYSQAARSAYASTFEGANDSVANVASLIIGKDLDTRRDEIYEDKNFAPNGTDKEKYAKENNLYYFNEKFYSDATMAEEKEVKDETVKAWTAYKKAVEEMANDAKEKVIELSNLYNDISASNGISSAEALFSMSPGVGGDFSSLSKNEITKLYSEGIKNYKDLGYESTQDFDKDWDDTIARYNEKIDKIKNDTTKALGRVGVNFINNITDSVSPENLQGIINTFDKTFRQIGEDGERYLYDMFNDIDSKDWNILSNILNSEDIDWSSEEALDEINALLEENGLEVDTSTYSWTHFIEKMKESSINLQSLKKDFDNLSASIADVKKIVSNLSIGSVISQEDYDKLVLYNSEYANFFRKTIDGWQLIDTTINGVKLDSVFDSGKESFKEYSDRLKKVGADAKHFENILLNVYEEVGNVPKSITAAGTDSLKKLFSKDELKTNSEEVKAILSEIGMSAETYSNTIKELESNNWDVSKLTTYKNSAEEIFNYIISRQAELSSGGYSTEAINSTAISTYFTTIEKVKDGLDELEAHKNDSDWVNAWVTNLQVLSNQSIASAGDLQELLKIQKDYHEVGLNVQYTDSYISKLKELAASYPECKQELEDFNNALKNEDIEETMLTELTLQYKMAVQDLGNASGLTASEIEKLSQNAADLGNALKLASFDTIDRSFDNIDEKLTKLKDDNKSIEIEAVLDSEEFIEDLNDLLTGDYTLELEIKTELTNEFDTIYEKLNNIKTLAGLVGENFLVSADNIRELAKTFPGILEGYSTTAEGMIQLNSQVVQDCFKSAGLEVEANSQAITDKLKLEISYLRGKSTILNNLADLYERQASGEVLTDEEKRKLKNQIEDNLSKYKQICEQEKKDSVIETGKAETTVTEEKTKAEKDSYKDLNSDAKEFYSKMQDYSELTTTQLMNDFAQYASSVQTFFANPLAWKNSSFTSSKSTLSAGSFSDSADAVWRKGWTAIQENTDPEAQRKKYENDRNPNEENTYERKQINRRMAKSILEENGIDIDFDDVDDLIKKLREQADAYGMTADDMEAMIVQIEAATKGMNNTIANIGKGDDKGGEKETKKTTVDEATYKPDDSTIYTSKELTSVETTTKAIDDLLGEMDKTLKDIDDEISDIDDEISDSYNKHDAYDKKINTLTEKGDQLQRKGDTLNTKASTQRDYLSNTFGLTFNEDGSVVDRETITTNAETTYKNNTADINSRYAQKQGEYNDKISTATQEWNAAITKYNNSSQDDAAKAEYETAKKKYEQAKTEAETQWTKDKEGFQKEKDDNETTYNNLFTFLESYDKTLEDIDQNQKDQKKNARQIKQAEQDQITSDHTIKTELSKRQLDTLKNAIKFIGSSLDKTTDRIAAYGEQMRVLEQKKQNLIQDIITLLMSKGVSLEDATAYATGTATQEQQDRVNEAIGNDSFVITTLQKYSDEMTDIASQMMETRDQALSEMSKAFKTMNDNLSRKLTEIANYTKAISTIRDIVNVIGKDILDPTRELGIKLAKNQLETQKSYTVAAKAKLEFDESALAEAEAALASLGEDVSDETRTYFEDLVKEAEDARNESYTTWLESWKEECVLAGEIFKAEMEKAQKEYENSVAGKAGTISELQTRYDREKTIDSNYLDDYEKIYNYSKLTRDIEKSMDNTKNIKGKKELAALVQQIHDLEESGADVSQYTVDNLRRQYELLQAKIQLEDARANKTALKLKRDSQGNYSYQYTSNDDDIASAQQNYEDKLYAIQDANKKYIDEMQSMHVQLLSEYKNYIDSLDQSADDYEEKKAAAYEYYLGQLQYYASEQQIVFDNNKTLYENEWTKYGEMNNLKIGSEDQYLTKFDATKLATVTGFETLNECLSTHEEAIKTLSDQASIYYDEYLKTVEDVMHDGGVSINTFAQVYGQRSDEMASKSHEAACAAWDMAENYKSAFKDIIDACVDFVEQYKAQINAAKALAQDFAAEVNKTTENATCNNSSKKGSSTTNNGKKDNNTTDDSKKDNGATVKQHQAAREVIMTEDQFNTYKNKLISEDVKDDRSVTAEKQADGTYRIVVYANGKSKNEVKAVVEGLTNELRNTTRLTTQYAYNKNGFSAGSGKTISQMATGGYTGNWNSTEGKLAILHEKELVLNKKDTENMLSAVKLLREATSSTMSNSNKQNIKSNTSNALSNDYRNALSSYFNTNSNTAEKAIKNNSKNTMSSIYKQESDEMVKEYKTYLNNLNTINTKSLSSDKLLKYTGDENQNIVINADFPNVQSSMEIETAFNNLVNRATQRAALRKK